MAAWLASLEPGHRFHLSGPLRFCMDNLQTVPWAMGETGKQPFFMVNGWLDVDVSLIENSTKGGEI